MNRFLLCSCFAIFAFNADAQPGDCKAITDPAERLRCFDQPKDCKSIADTAARLKCFDGQSSAAPAVAPEPPAYAAKFLSAEPPIGQLPTGAKALVDDGTCPAGKIKQVIGGNASAGQPRVRSCVPRP